MWDRIEITDNKQIIVDFLLENRPIVISIIVLYWNLNLFRMCLAYNQHSSQRNNIWLYSIIITILDLAL